MRRLCLALLAALAVQPILGQAGFAQPAGPAQPPHAFLFGTWTGGLFPVSGPVPPQVCLSQPVVIFTRDLVMRATLTEQTLTQREIESVRVVPGGFEFRLAAGGAAPSLLQAGGGLAGFGCETPDSLHVVRRGENEIAFPGCADFPNPLVRCR